MYVVSFAHDFVVNGIYYNITSRPVPFISSSTPNEVAVTYQGSSPSVNSFDYVGSIIIPSSVTHNGITYDVTGIDRYAFENCKSMYSVNIPSSVKSISGDAFYGCSNLNSIIVDKGNTKYDSRDKCNAIIATETNTLIRGCSTTVIPNSVKKLGSSAFFGCSELKSITIPNSVTTIGERAFSGCSRLTSITIPNSVIEINDNAFSGCSGLKKVIVSDIAKWCLISFGGISANPLGYAHHLYSDENTEIKELIIPNSVTSIGGAAFSGCSGLTSVTIPNSVTKIGGNAFYDCSNLMSVTINSNAVLSINYSSSNNLKSIFGGNVKEFTIGRDVTTIGKYAFSNYTSVVSVSFGSGIKNIRERAFDGCTGIREIVIPNSIETIDDWAFCYCTNMKSLILGSSLQRIGLGAFMQCYNLESVYVPNHVKSLGIQAFAECIKLKNISFGSSLQSIGQGCFYLNKSLKKVTLPNSLTELGKGVFYRCENLESLKLSSSLSTIEYMLADSCSSLKEIYIPSSVTRIEDLAFNRCYSLTKIVMEKNVKIIGEGAFQNCNDLEDIYSFIEKPFTINDNVFNSETNVYRFAKLHIPNSTSSRYKSVKSWNLFDNIVEMSNDEYEEIIGNIEKDEDQKDVIIKIPVEVSATGYATFYDANIAYILPTTLSAQVVILNASGKIFYKTIANGDANGIVPKGVPVILVSNNRKGGTYTLTSTTESASYSGENLLHGSSLMTMTSNINGVSTSGSSSYVYYKLAYGRSGSASASKLGWYWGANNGAAFTIAGGKAWLALPKTSAQSLSDVLFIDDDATSIEGVEQSEMKGAIDAQYNMAGQRVGNGYNGIIIVNGKKVIR